MAANSKPVDVASTTPVNSLPFISAPKVETIRIGNERTGILEFPRYWDLTVNESAWLQSNTASKTAFQYTSKLALKIARAEKVQPIVAHTFVAKVLAAAMGGQLELTEKEQTWSVKYVRELEETAMNVLEVSVQNEAALVTCVIRHRLPGMGHWSQSDTANLPAELVDEIYKFALGEQKRGDFGDVEDAQEEVVEMLGKSQTELMKEAQESTGEEPSTSSESSTQETPSSQPADSDA